MAATILRRATPEDAALLAAHRVGMFRDMGAVAPGLEPVLHAASMQYFQSAIASGDYVGWLAAPADDPGHPIAGAGLQLRPMLPRPDPPGGHLLTGLEGLVLNVYVDVAWRRRGIARRLMQELLVWTSAHDVVRPVLHASDDGRALYESMGFITTNEMRFTGPLAPSDPRV
jgi:GNAT superfamily N-acetyltransferase